MHTKTSTNQTVAKVALSVPVLHLSAMPFKRGDVVDVSLATESRSYTGVVRSASKANGVYVIDSKGEVQSYDLECSFVKLTLRERLGARKRETLFDLAKSLH